MKPRNLSTAAFGVRRRDVFRVARLVIQFAHLLRQDDHDDHSDSYCYFVCTQFVLKDDLIPSKQDIMDEYVSEQAKVE